MLHHLIQWQLWIQRIKTLHLPKAIFNKSRSQLLTTDLSQIFRLGFSLKIEIRRIKMFFVSFNRQDNCWNLFKLQWRWNTCRMCRQWKYLQSWNRKKFSRRGHWTPNRLHDCPHMQRKRTSKLQWYRNALSMQTKSTALWSSCSCPRKMIWKVTFVFRFLSRDSWTQKS